MATRFDVDAIRSALPVSEVLAHFGARPLRAGRGPCPLCGTSDGSTCFSSRPSRPSSWKCFACNEGGSSIDLWAALSGLDFRQTIKAMAGHLGLAPDQTPPDVALTRKIARELIRERAAAASNRERLRLNALAARAYHSERAEVLFREAARLVGYGEAGMEYARRAQECAEAKEESDRGLAAHSERA